MKVGEMGVAHEGGWRKIAIAQVCAFLSPIWRTKGAKLRYRLVTTATATQRIFEIISGRHPRVLARNSNRQEVCNEKVRPFRFLPCCSRYRDYLGVRLVSACLTVGKPQPLDSREQGQPSPQSPCKFVCRLLL